MIRACAVGDFVLNLPALEALQQCHPGSVFTLVGYPSTLTLAREFVDVASMHSIELEPWRRLFHEPVGGLAFDRAIVWMKDSAVAENLRRSGIKNVVRADPFPVEGHAAAHLLGTLSLTPPRLPDRWKPQSNRIILHPGSGSPKKCWPHFLELAARLGSAQFLIGPVEADFDAGMYRRLENLSLPEVSKALVASRGFVGNDSGITHLAAYLGVPTLALFGPTDPKVWGPIGKRVSILRKPDIQTITVDEVEPVVTTVF